MVKVWVLTGTWPPSAATFALVPPADAFEPGDVIRWRASARIEVGLLCVELPVEARRLDALDALVAERDALAARLRDAESVTFSGTVTRLLQRAEAAEARLAEAEREAVLERMDEEWFFRVLWKQTIDANLNTVEGCEQAAKVLSRARAALAAADRPEGTPEGMFVPEGDERCNVRHRDANATCLRRKGHGGPHAGAMGHWIDGPWCDRPEGTQCSASCPASVCFETEGPHRCSREAGHDGDHRFWCVRAADRPEGTTPTDEQLLDVAHLGGWGKRVRKITVCDVCDQEIRDNARRTVRYRWFDWGFTHTQERIEDVCPECWSEMSAYALAKKSGAPVTALSSSIESGERP